MQNKQKLAEIQGNVDTSGLERMPDHPITAEYRVSKACRENHFSTLFS